MKIVYAALYDPRNVQRGSGTPFYLTREIERQGYNLLTIDISLDDIPLLTRILKSTSRYFGKKYRTYLDPFVGKNIGLQIRQKIGLTEFDVLITNDICIAAYTNIPKPIIVYTDAIFPHKYSENLHPWLKNLFPLSVMFAQHITKRGLEKSSLCIFASEFANQQAYKYNPNNEHKLSVIPYGANIDDPGAYITKKRSFARIKERNYLKMLFIGKDWQLKGGDIAIQTLQKLRELDLNAFLHVIGSVPPYQVNPDTVKLHGLLRKNIQREKSLLEQIFIDSDVFILPSAAEGFGIAFAEAAAYGLPSLGYKTTGVLTSVKDGVSGILIDLYTGAESFSEIIQSWYQNPIDYDRLSIGARKHYEQTVNWETAIQELMLQIKRIL